jgi:hypothetical protein
VPKITERHDVTPHFTSVHFGLAFLFQMLVYASAITPVKDAFEPGLMQKLAVFACFLACGFAGLMLADLMLDYGFRFADAPKAAADAWTDARSFWAFLIYLRHLAGN